MAGMRRLHGLAASEGIAIGQVRMLATRLLVGDRWIAPQEVAGELRRLDKAVATTDDQLLVISRRLEASKRHDGHTIIEAHRLMLKSDALVLAAQALIRDERLAAEAAVRRVVDGIVATFDAMDDAYLRERGSDVEAVGERLLQTLAGDLDLQGQAGWREGAAAGAIGAGDALSAIDAFRLHAAGLAGLVTERGGQTSHAS